MSNACVRNEQSMEGQVELERRSMDKVKAVTHSHAMWKFTSSTSI